MESNNVKFELSIDDIYNFSPAIDYKGYSPMEVDQLLDKVIIDYETYNKLLAEKNEAISNKDNDFLQVSDLLSNKLEVIRKKDNELAMCQAKIDDLNNQIAALQQQLAMNNRPVEMPKTEDASNNIDILRRLARLETAVFRDR